MRLEVLCRYRAQVEDLVRLELAELDYRLQAAVARHDEGRRRANTAAVRYTNGSKSGLAASDTTWQYHAWEAATQEQAYAEDLLARAQGTRDAKQAELVLAIRERKQMEILVQRRARHMQLRQWRREQREMDDFANGRWALTLRKDGFDEGNR
ncbi:hypothetical protein YTPLAS18_27520 [Nitrospira sp.]|nr:hypothetical protein YTPLAS18_27520 [Nitrospira sp.]